MDYRDPPPKLAEVAVGRDRDGEGEGVGGGGGGDGPKARARRFEFVRPARRLDVTRLVLAAGALLAATALAGFAGVKAVRSSFRWLRDQPQYRVAFAEIELVEPPPPWFRGGSKAFLEKVRLSAREPEVLPFLDLEEGRIADAFRLFPWVRRVERVEYPPRAIRVRLTYRVPVAVLNDTNEAKHPVDAEGYLLPAEDIDPERLESLVTVAGPREKPLPPPAETKPGLPWRPSESGPDAREREGLVREAIRLAAFLDDPERRREAKANPALQVFEIQPNHPWGLFVFLMDRGRSCVLWGRGRGPEEAEGPSDADRWEMLRRWAARPEEQRTPGKAPYWVFEKGRLQPVLPRPRGASP